MFPLVKDDRAKIGRRHIRDRQQSVPLGLVRPPPLANTYYENQNGYRTSAPTEEAVKTGVWNYMLGVSICLVAWVFILMLPKGVRKQFFGANPRRYTKRRYDMEELSTNMSAMDSVNESFLREVERRRMTDVSMMSSVMPSTAFSPSTQGGFSTTNQTATNTSRALSTISDSDTGSLYLRPMTRSTRKASRASSTTAANSSLFRASPSLGLPPPSPGHPAIPRLPSAKILNETMQRLKSRGIRLLAHGVASDSKRVWIKFEEDTTSLSWQTEFARKCPNQLGEISIVMMRGAMHRIGLPNILYVDVGKKTNALTKPENKDVPDSVCFSLLTQNGSLDLQANSRLERDALVSSFSMVLDEVHTQDWRSLYAESPETSVVQSVCTGSDLNQVEF